MIREIILSIVVCGTVHAASAQQQLTPDAEIFQPEPKKVSPGNSTSLIPSDAIALFDGTNLNEWVSTKDITKPATWKLGDGILTVDKKAGDIQTKRKFMDYQLHLEWRIPRNITGEGQSRGNSGIILSSSFMYDFRYELQILDSYTNKTYVNGQAGAIYKQYVPLVNACKKPGEWQSYDIVWTAPRFNEDGSLKSAPRVTAFYNGILIQNNVELRSPEFYPKDPAYKKNEPTAIKLQSHGDPSEPISYRNIWVRELN